MFDLGEQGVLVKILTDEHNLVRFRCARFPVVIFDREAFTAEVKDVARGAFVEPKDALGAEDIRG